MDPATDSPLPPEIEPTRPTKRGAGFWILIAVSALVLLCGCGAGLLFYFGRDWFDIATAPQGERLGLLSKKLESLAGERMLTVNDFLKAVDEKRDDDAWALTSPAFRSSTTREKFSELTGLVRDVMGRCVSRELRNFNAKDTIGGPNVTTLVFAGKFEKGEGTISLELESAAGGWAVRTWRTDSPLFVEAMKRGTGK